eukprot:TRINITY_DN6263_c0_g1_i2.p1 TRINITY_DN6263_c0_g1~~TRINITY_DN6263_c0_g1_i2.p1  ORF type:complete len:691 (+),score=133.15 TRINITY_DN6263_c0_g1_i2:24-2096(+)
MSGGCRDDPIQLELFVQYDDAQFIEALSAKFLATATAAPRRTSPGVSPVAPVSPMQPDATPSSPAQMLHQMFVRSLHRLTQLRQAVGTELAVLEGRAAEAESRVAEQMENSQRDVATLLQQITATTSRLSRVSDPVRDTAERLQGFERQIDRAEAATVLMDNLKAFDVTTEAMDALLQRLSKKCQELRSRAREAQKRWEQNDRERHERRRQTLRLRAVSAQVLSEDEKETSDHEDEESDDSEDDDATAARLPSVFLGVTSGATQHTRTEAVEELLKLQSLCRGLELARCRRAVANVRRYAEWLEQQLRQDFDCHLDCYDMVVQHLNRYGGEADLPVPLLKSSAQARKHLDLLRQTSSHLFAISSGSTHADDFLDRQFHQCVQSLPQQQAVTVNDLKGMLASFLDAAKATAAVAEAVFPDSTTLMRRLLLRFVEEVLEGLIDTVLRNTVPVSGLRGLVTPPIQAAVQAAAQVAMGQVKKGTAFDKELLVLQTYQQAVEQIRTHLAGLRTAKEACDRLVAEFPGSGGGADDVARQRVAAAIHPFLDAYMDWEVQLLRLSTYHTIATSRPEPTVRYACHTAPLLLLQALEAAAQRSAALTPTANLSYNLHKLCLQMTEHFTQYLEAALDMATKAIKHAFEKLNSNSNPSNMAGLEGQPHVAILRVVSWAHQTVLKLERHYTFHISPLIAGVPV